MAITINILGEAAVEIDSTRYAPGGGGEEPPPPENQSPSANSGGFSIIEGQTLTVDLKPYFSDPDGTATLTDATPVGGGVAVSLVGNGVVEVTSTGSAGTDVSFTYEVTDDDGATATGTMTGTVLAAGGGQDVGELSNMMLVPTGEDTAELRFDSTVAGTAEISTTHWSNAVPKIEIDRMDGNNPRPGDHEPRGDKNYYSVNYARFTAPVVNGSNVIVLSNEDNQTKYGGLQKGQRIAAHFYITKSGGGDTQVFNSNTAELFGREFEGDFTSGDFQLTAPQPTTITQTVTGGPFAGSYPIDLPLVQPLILGDHKPVLMQDGSDLVVAPPPMVWPTKGQWNAAKKWSVADPPTRRVRWSRDGSFVEETTSLTRAASPAGDWSAEYLETKGGQTLSATSDPLAVS